MGKIGVMAVVDGLTKFEGDIGKIDNLIRKLATGPTHILQGAFEGLGNVMSGLAGGALRVLEYTLGSLLSSAIQFVGGQVKQLVSDTIEAGAEFQRLTIRLNQLNFNDLAESVQDEAYAMDIANIQTEKQLGWLQRLAATTPFDNADISRIYTLARGYSFADQDARGLVETLSDFTSGMGLGDVEMTRIIKNLGQMQQLGKVTQRELNDLAVGAFVPVNEILEKMREETGLVGDAFNDFRNSGEGVASFLRNFTALVEDDFGGAASRMARTFGAATDNFKDFFKSIIGLNVVTPVLDVMGSKIADFMDKLTAPERWSKIVNSANNIGNSVSSIIKFITGMGPSAEGMADLVVEAFDKVSDWFEENSPKIKTFLNDLVKGFKTDLLPAIQDVWKFLFGSEGEPGAIQKFGAWIQDDLIPFIQNEAIPGIMALIDAITGVKAPVTSDPKDRGDTAPDPTTGENIVATVQAVAAALPAVLELLATIGGVIAKTFGGDEVTSFADFITFTVIPAIQSLTEFIRENEAAVQTLFAALLLLEVFGFIVGLVISLVTAFLSLVVAETILGGVLAVVISLYLAVQLMGVFLIWLVGVVATTLRGIIDHFNMFKDNVIETWDAVKTALMSGDFAAAGRALVEGIVKGVQSRWAHLISVVTSLAKNALAAFNKVFNVRSPSKEMFDVGQNIVKGLIQGVERSSGKAVKAMATTAASMLSAASPKMAYSMATNAPSQNTYQTNNNFNMEVNTSAQKEPIISDFGLMQSMVSS